MLKMWRVHITQRRRQPLPVGLRVKSKVRKQAEFEDHLFHPQNYFVEICPGVEMKMFGLNHPLPPCSTPWCWRVNCWGKTCSLFVFSLCAFFLSISFPGLPFFSFLWRRNLPPQSWSAPLFYLHFLSFFSFFFFCHLIFFLKIFSKISLEKNKKFIQF